MKAEIKISDQFKKIDGSNSDDFAKEMIKIEESGLDEVEVNMDGVRSINSMGIGSLYSAFSKFKEGGRKLKITNPTDDVRRLLELAVDNTLLDD